MIPKSTSITQNLMKLHVHRSVNLTRSNFVLFCDLIPELRSLVSLSYMGGIEKKEDDLHTPLTLGLEKKDDHTLTFEEKEDDAEDDDDTLAVGRALGRMIRNSSNLVTLILPTLGLSETFEFSKGIFHTSSLKNLSFSIRPDKEYGRLYFNIPQVNYSVRFKDLPEDYQMPIRREMNSTLFETMRNIANSRGLCDVRIFLTSTLFSIQSIEYAKRIEKLKLLDLRRYPKRSYEKRLPSNSVNKSNLLTLLAGCGGSTVSLDILITLLLIRQRGRHPLISRVIPAVMLLISMFGAYKVLRTVGICTPLETQVSVGCPCGSAALEKLGNSRIIGVNSINEWNEHVMTYWICPHCGTRVRDY